MTFLLGVLCLAAAVFDVASLKRSAEQRGIDYRGHVTVSTGRVNGRNVTLGDMVATAYHVQLAQVSPGSLKWVESDEFDLDARGEGSLAELRQMLQGLLKERFHLELNREVREVRGYALVVDKGGPRLNSTKGSERFHGTMRQFADLLGVQATIAAPVDPSKPAVASSAPVLVLDQTGLEGEYEFSVEMQPEPGTDRFVQWQRALREQLGLNLKSQKLNLVVLAVRRANPVPTTN